MKQLLIIPAIALAACTPPPQQCGPIEAVVISYTKTGFPIVDDQSPILPPCEVATYSQPKTPLPPVSGPPMTPEPPFAPPVAKVKGNNGFGNGNQDASGNSEFNNAAENRGGNHSGRDDASANSWHGD